MRTARTLAALALVGATSAVSAGAAPSGGVRDGGTFRYAIPAETVESLDPYLDISFAMQAVRDATCGSLLHRRDQPLPAGRRLAAELAVGFPRVSNRGKTYVFTVKRGQRFSTGAEVTARDVAASVERALRLKGSQRMGDFANVLGAQAYAHRRAASLRGLTIESNRVTFRLTKPQPNFGSLAGTLCILPVGSTLDPEGVRAPVPSAGPYRIASYLPGRRIVLVRNRLYRGPRPHHVDRIDVTLVADGRTLVDAIEHGTYDEGFVGNMAPYAARLAARYGVNRQRFFVRPGDGVCLLHMNASRPLFRQNTQLRRAVNFAIDRTAITTDTAGGKAGAPTDQYLLPSQSAFHDARIYPARPDVKKAQALARGHLRGGKAVFVTPDGPVGRTLGAIIARNLAAIGLEVEVEPIPFKLSFTVMETNSEPWDLGYVCWGSDDLTLHTFFDGRTLDQPGHSNYSHFDSATFNRRLDEVTRLTGRAFARAYGDLDVELARTYAPAAAMFIPYARTFVSARTGCVITNPNFDLTAVCLK